MHFFSTFFFFSYFFFLGGVLIYGVCFVANKKTLILLIYLG
nr:MAG TPA: hypothetical protein [Caudoviricetes sp.]